MSRINRKARRRIKRKAVKDAGIGIARCLLVRALRQGGMQHAIAGSPCVVGIIVERPADLEMVSRAGRLMFQRMLRDVAVGGYKVLDWEDGSKAQRNAKYDGNAADVIATNSHVFGVATDAETFRPAFRLAADGFVTVRAADASALVAANLSAGISSALLRVIVNLVNLQGSELLYQGATWPAHDRDRLRSVRREQASQSRYGPKYPCYRAPSVLARISGSYSSPLILPFEE